MPVATISKFVSNLLQSQLLDLDQRVEVQRLGTSCRDARELAHEVLRREYLTAFQVNQILQGKGVELTMGPFILLERIGEGGMGQVFKARQKMLNRVVALKVIRKQCLGNPKVILRFQREIRAAGQLSHPHIVRAYDADQINGTYYIAMEYIEGDDLAKLVKDNGPLPIDQACEYIRQAALGLQHAFERGMVHRDIKPANLLVARAVASDRRRSSGIIQRPANFSPLSADSSGVVARGSNLLPRAELAQHYPWGVLKILDMGLARCTDPFTGQASTHLTQIGSVMGTPEYIAPEQARDSHTSDIRADLYSLGCTLYFLLTGHPPFPNGTLTEKLLQHQLNEAEPVAKARRTALQSYSTNGARKPPDGGDRRAHVPAAVDALICRLLAKRPEQRFETPIALADELQTILKRLTAGAGEQGRGLETTVPIDAVKLPALPASGNSSQTVLEPIVLLTQKPPPNYTTGKIAVVLATLASLAVVTFLTLLAILMSASNPMRANTKTLDGPKPKLKADDGKPKR